MSETSKLRWAHLSREGSGIKMGRTNTEAEASATEVVDTIAAAGGIANRNRIKNKARTILAEGTRIRDEDRSKHLHH